MIIIVKDTKNLTFLVPEFTAARLLSVCTPARQFDYTSSSLLGVLAYLMLYNIESLSGMGKTPLMSAVCAGNPPSHDVAVNAFPGTFVRMNVARVFWNKTMLAMAMAVPLYSGICICHVLA